MGLASLSSICIFTGPKVNCGRNNRMAQLELSPVSPDANFAGPAMLPTEASVPSPHAHRRIHGGDGPDGERNTAAGHGTRRSSRGQWARRSSAMAAGGRRRLSLKGGLGVRRRRLAGREQPWRPRRATVWGQRRSAPG